MTAAPVLNTQCSKITKTAIDITEAAVAIAVNIPLTFASAFMMMLQLMGRDTNGKNLFELFQDGAQENLAATIMRDGVATTVGIGALLGISFFNINGLEALRREMVALLAPTTTREERVTAAKTIAAKFGIGFFAGIPMAVLARMMVDDVVGRDVNRQAPWLADLIQIVTWVAVGSSISNPVLYTLKRLYANYSDFLAWEDRLAKRAVGDLCRALQTHLDLTVSSPDELNTAENVLAAAVPVGTNLLNLLGEEHAGEQLVSDLQPLLLQSFPLWSARVNMLLQCVATALAVFASYSLFGLSRLGLSEAPVALALLLAAGAWLMNAILWSGSLAGVVPALLAPRSVLTIYNGYTPKERAGVAIALVFALCFSTTLALAALIGKSQQPWGLRLSEASVSYAVNTIIGLSGLITVWTFVYGLLSQTPYNRLNGQLGALKDALRQADPQDQKDFLRLLQQQAEPRLVAAVNPDQTAPLISKAGVFAKGTLGAMLSKSLGRHGFFTEQPQPEGAVGAKVRYGAASVASV